LPPEPYPGLRPFELHEHRIFFGREEMIDTVIDGLARNNLVVVHGASGSGKSSLVRAGVLPLLDIQQGRRRRWLTAIQRPAGGPLRNLASALADLLDPPSDPIQAIDPASAWHRRLALGRTVLDDIEASLNAREASLCVLIDQFEELFRYAREKSRQEAELLTELLCVLTGKDNPAPHLFVILTMRSDYLGECARFEGFAETVNSCQYLVPRLNDFALLRAIHEPATLYGGKIDVAVGDHLLFAARHDEDALPVLQHTLMRAYARARERHGAGPGWTVTLGDLQAVGGRHGALSTHADAILAEVRARESAHVKAAEWVFRCLTELDAEGRVIRRPRHLGELVAVAANDRGGVTTVIEAFRGTGRHFLMTNRQGPLEDDTEIDVSHEALIRRWRQLSDPARDPVRNEPVGWMWREFEDGQRWRALAVQARVFRDDSSKGATLSPATTEAYGSWWTEHSPAWAARYVRDQDLASAEYQEVQELWEASKEAARKRLRLQYIASASIVLAAALLTATLLVAWVQWQRAESELEKSQTTQSMFLAFVARERRTEGDAGTALLLALEALPDSTGIARPYVPEAELQLDGTLRTLRELVVLGHDNAVLSAAFSPDGRRIVTASADKTARLWGRRNRQARR
jgi:hypothetical protein